MAFALVARGNCSFEGKARVAQQAGFDAAVVYEDEDKASLYFSECLPPPASLPLPCYAALPCPYQFTSSTLDSWYI